MNLPAVQPQEQPPFLTVDELAARWGVNVKTIYEAIRLKQVPALRLGKKLLRIPRAAVEKLEMQQGRVVPQGEKDGGPTR